MQQPDAKELALLAAAKLYLTRCEAKKTAVMDLQTPDGTRKIIDSDAKFLGLQLLSLEVDQLVEGVAGDLKGNSLVLGQTADERLRNAYVAV